MLSSSKGPNINPAWHFIDRTWENYGTHLTSQQLPSVPNLVGLILWLQEEEGQANPSILHRPWLPSRNVSFCYHLVATNNLSTRGSWKDCKRLLTMSKVNLKKLSGTFLNLFFEKKIGCAWLNKKKMFDIACVPEAVHRAFCITGPPYSLL